MGATFTVNEPNSMAVQLARQYGTGGRIFLVGHIADPATAFAEVGPQISEYFQRQKQGGFELDHVIKVKDLPPIAQGNQLAMITYGITRSDGDSAGHYQAMAQVSVTPLGPQAWMVWMIEMAARDDKAKDQMPQMIAIVNSWKVNQQAVNAINQQQIAGQNEWFAAQQAGHKAQTDAFDAQHAQYWKDSNARSRMNDNADEALRGVRDLEDTTTGELHSVDLGQIDQLQAKLNEVDPDRWKQIPLRDKVDPLPAH